MNLTLRSIKVFLPQSHETFCFTARLYVDGRPVADVENGGYGGPNEIHITNGAFTESQINDYVKDNFPPHPPSKLFPEGIPESLEGWISDRIADYLTRRDMNRLMRKMVLYTEGGDEDALWNIPHRGKVKDVTLHIREKHPSAIILNELDADSAFVIYKSFG